MKKILVTLSAIALVMLMGCNSKTSTVTAQNTDNKNIINKNEISVEEEFNVERIPQFLTNKSINIKGNMEEKHSSLSTRPSKIGLTQYKDNSLLLSDKNNDKNIKRRVWIYSYTKDKNISSSDSFNLAAYMFENNKWESVETLGEAVTIAHVKEINSENKNAITLSNTKTGLYIFKLVTIYSDLTISETAFNIYL